MPDVPLISVVMPVYNARQYLAEAVESILAQTFGDFEFVCVDDGSTDDSLAILNDFAKRDPRVKIVSRPNTGVWKALNDGIEVSRGQLIARMDADDVSLPQRFAFQRVDRVLFRHVAILRLQRASRPAAELLRNGQRREDRLRPLRRRRPTAARVRVL